MRLLIVDDEMWSRKLIRKLLPWDDYGIDSIYEAEDGSQALDIINKHDIDLLITDMRMPGVDGAMLLQTIHDSNINIEVIVMSGYEDYKYLHSALKTKAIDYLLKPVVKEELHTAVMTGISKTLKKDSHKYIEEILLREDLRNELNRYYELKNTIIKAITSYNKKDILGFMDILEEEFFSSKANPNFTNYIMMDLKRSISDLEKENGIERIVEIIPSLKNLSDRMLVVSNKLDESTNKEKVSVLKIQRYIEKHLDENISLSDIADRFYVSKEHLSRLFKKEVGVSVQNYITDKKIEYAKSLLRNYKMITISNIPSMCGYNDLHYFYRIFKKVTGETPVEYRSRYQNNTNNISK